jgi:hypothetical protein
MLQSSEPDPEKLNHEGQRHVKEGKHSTDPGVKER